MALAAVCIVHFSCNGQPGPKPESNPMPVRADLPISQVTGHLEESDKVVHLSASVQRMLFILEQGSIFLPETGFYLHLRGDEAKKYGREWITVIPLFEVTNSDIFYGSYGKDLQFELIKMPGLEDVYYSKNIDYFRAHNSMKVNPLFEAYPPDIFNTVSRDTIEWSQISHHLDLRDVPKWIEKMNSTDFVMVHLVGCAETTNGYRDIHSYDKKLLSELAEVRLERVTRNMDMLGTPQEGATQAQWRKWMDSIRSIDLNKVTGTAAFSVNSKSFNEDGHAIASTDRQKNMLIRLIEEPQYKNYKDQQVIMFKPADDQFSTAEINFDGQATAKDFIALHAANDTLYTLNEFADWAKYVLSKGADGKAIYKQVATRQVINQIKKGNDPDFEIDQQIINAEATYILWHRANTRNYQLLKISTQTGALLGTKSLAEDFAGTKLEYMPFNYHAEQGDGIGFLTKTGETVRHVRYNSSLVKTEDINLGEDIPWYPSYINTRGAAKPAGREFYYDRGENALDFYVLDNGRLETVHTPLPAQVFDNFRLMAYDDGTLRLFYEYGDAFAHGIKTVRIDAKTFQPVGEHETIFARVQLENESSDNTPGEMNAFQMQKGWAISFVMENAWYVVQEKK